MYLLWACYISGPAQPAQCPTQPRTMTLHNAGCVHRGVHGPSRRDAGTLYYSSCLQRDSSLEPPTGTLYSSRAHKKQLDWEPLLELPTKGFIKGFFTRAAHREYLLELPTKGFYLRVAHKRILSRPRRDSLLEPPTKGFFTRIAHRESLLELPTKGFFTRVARKEILY